jgi:hypothetical protein
MSLSIIDVDGGCILRQYILRRNTPVYGEILWQTQCME